MVTPVDSDPPAPMDPWQKLPASAGSSFRLEYLATAATTLLERLFAAILEDVVTQFQADTASLMLLNRETERLEVRAVVGLRDALVATSGLRVGEGIAGWVMADGKPLLLQGDVEGRFAGAMAQEGVQSSMLAPVRLRGEVLGVLCVSSRQEGRQFTDDDLAALAGLADGTALAVRNAHIYEEAVRELERLRTLQQAKQDFIYGAVQEIGSSLRRVRQRVDNLTARRRLKAAAAQELLSVLEAEENRIASISENLLDVAGVEVRPIRLRLRPVDLCALAAILGQELTQRLPGRQVILDVPASLPTVRGDVRSLAEVLRALTDALAALGPQDSPLRISCQQSMDSDSVVVTVTGAQPWTSPDALGVEGLFAGLYDSGRALELERVGLNIFIARGLVEACGGRLGVCGGLGANTAFRFSLPLS